MNVPPITRRTPAEVRAYIDGFEEGAHRALGHVADQRPDLKDVTMAAAERIGSMVTAMQATVARLAPRTTMSELEAEVARLERLALERYQLACRYEREAEQLRKALAREQSRTRSGVRTPAPGYEPGYVSGSVHAAVCQERDRYRGALVCIADMSLSPYGDLRQIARAALNEDTDR